MEDINAPLTKKSAMPANDRQPGGTHYFAAVQHWDLVAVLGMGYFEGQITKYLTRHRKKNGLLDLEKAEHFLEKLIELRAAGVESSMSEKSDCARLRYNTLFSSELLKRAGAKDAHQDVPRKLFEAFVASQSPPLQSAEVAAIFTVCFWQRPDQLSYALRLIRSIKAQYPAPSEETRA